MSGICPQLLRSHFLTLGLISDKVIFVCLGLWVMHTEPKSVVWNGVSASAVSVGTSGGMETEVWGQVLYSVVRVMLLSFKHSQNTKGWSTFVAGASWWIATHTLVHNPAREETRQFHVWNSDGLRPGHVSLPLCDCTVCPLSVNTASSNVSWVPFVSY